MAGRFEATTEIDRPIQEVFDFLADGENDRKFSARIIEIAKTTDPVEVLQRPPRPRGRSAVCRPRPTVGS